MKLIRNLFILVAVYLIAYAALPGPARAVKRIDLATVMAWGVSTPQPDDFKQKVKLFAKAKNYDPDIGLYDALNGNEFVSDLSISVDSRGGVALVTIQYSLPDRISVSMTFVTNKTSLIPERAEMESIFSALMAKNPTLVDIKVTQDGQVNQAPVDDGSGHGVLMPLGDRLQLELLADVFSNDKNKIVALPKAFIGSKQAAPRRDDSQARSAGADQGTAADDYGLAYKVPQLAFTADQLQAELKRKDLAPFSGEVEKFLTAPKQFISECVASSAAYSREKGGLGEKEALQWGVSACKQHIDSFSQCLGAADAGEAVACFDKLSQQGD